MLFDVSMLIVGGTWIATANPASIKIIESEDTCFVALVSLPGFDLLSPRFFLSLLTPVDAGDTTIPDAVDDADEGSMDSRWTCFKSLFVRKICFK